MNLKQLTEFLVVAQEQQITAAAKRLYMAQPPLSYQMKQLEKELNVKLFTRSSYGIELTTAGKIFQDYAQKMVKTNQAALEALSSEHAGEAGTVHLGLISSTGSLIPNQAIRKLTTYYPQVNFEITENNTMNLINRLNSGLIDLAIVRTPFNMRGLAKLDLQKDHLVAIGNHHFFNFPTDKMKIADFDHQPLILYRRFEAIFNDTFAHHGISPFYSVKCDDARTAITWANNGMGIAIVPQLAAQTWSTQPLTPIDYPSWDSCIQVVWQKDASLNQVTTKFIKLLTHN